MGNSHIASKRGKERGGRRKWEKRKGKRLERSATVLFPFFISFGERGQPRFYGNGKEGLSNKQNGILETRRCEMRWVYCEKCSIIGLKSEVIENLTAWHNFCGSKCNRVGWVGQLHSPKVGVGGLKWKWNKVGALWKPGVGLSLSE